MTQRFLLAVLLGVASAQLPPVSVVRGADGVPALARSGKVGWLPRGLNFVRLNQSIGGAPGCPAEAAYHSTFSPGTLGGNRTRTPIANGWNASAADAALAAMHAAGYDIARVFVDTGGWFRDDGIGGEKTARTLSDAYMSNLAAFVKLAAKHSVYVVPTVSGLPIGSENGFSCNASQQQFGYPNNLYLAADCVRARGRCVTRSLLTSAVSFFYILPTNSLLLVSPSLLYLLFRYVAAVIASLERKLGGDLSAIAFLSIENEAAVSSGQPPFTLQSGAVTAANGKSYDMGVDAQRAALASEGGTFWASSVCAAAKEAAAGELLCTSGMFSMQAVQKDYKNYTKAMPHCKAPMDCRVPIIPEQLQKATSVDLVDFHVYQVPVPTGQTWSLQADLASSNWASLAGNDNSLPVIQGEFGAWKANPDLFASAELAAKAMVAQQVASCKSRFRGFMLWTWDTWEQPRLWNAQSDKGQIGAALSPKRRPDACESK